MWIEELTLDSQSGVRLDTIIRLRFLFLYSFQTYSWGILRNNREYFSWLYNSRFLGHLLCFFNIIICTAAILYIWIWNKVAYLSLTSPSMMGNTLLCHWIYKPAKDFIRHVVPKKQYKIFYFRSICFSSFRKYLRNILNTSFRGDNLNTLSAYTCSTHNCFN